MSDAVSTVPVSTGINTYIEAMKLVEQMSLPKLYDASNPNSRVFFALADGTENDVNNPNMGPATNIGILSKAFKDIQNNNIAAGYIAGPGTQGGLAGELDSATGFSYTEKAEQLYKEFCYKAKEWLSADPNAEISLGELGFSRGSAVIAKFNQLVHERGIVDPDSAVEFINRHNSEDPTEWTHEVTYEKVLQVPGTIAQSVIVYDPVFTGLPGTENLVLSSSTISAIQFTALNEYRALFASTSLVNPGLSEDGRYLNTYLAGAHSDIGGGYVENGLSSLNFNMTANILNTMLGSNIVTPASLPSDESAYVLHNSVEGEWFYTKTLNREMKYSDLLAGGSSWLDSPLSNMYDYASLVNDNPNSALGLSPELQAHISEIIATVSSGVSNLIDGVSTYGPTILDALSLIKAIQSGEPLPIIASGIRLANDIAIRNDAGNAYLSGATSLATGILSVMSLSHALENGDALGAIVSGSSTIAYAASAYVSFAAATNASAGIATELSEALLGTNTTNALGLTNGVVPYLNLVNAIAKGDEAGIAVGTISLIPGMQWVGIAYSVFSMISSLFGGDEIPDPWGNGKYVWDGNGISYQSAGETGGNEAVRNVMSNVLAVLNNLIEQQRLTNPTSALGIIPNRMPTIAYDMSGYRYTDIDPLTGVEKHAYLRYDTQGNPYNATPGSDESYQSIIEAMVRSALTRSAIAPLWEVQTAKMQTDAGDPKAGLTEEARAGRNGALASAITGATQTFRPVTLDLSGNAQIDILSKESANVNFDVDDSGFLKDTAWIDGGDANCDTVSIGLLLSRIKQRKFHSLHVNLFH